MLMVMNSVTEWSPMRGSELLPVLSITCMGTPTMVVAVTSALSG
jgi:hypothetical protein